MRTLYPELSLDLTFHPVVNLSPRRFTPAQIDAYNREGFITGVPLFTGERLKRLQDHFVRDKARVTVPPDVGFESYHHAVPWLYDLVTDALLVEYLRDLLGDDIVCHASQFIRKEPGEGPQVVWHQDSSYNPCDAKCVVVWLAVEDADVANGCMWFIPGSHRLGQLACGADHRVLLAEELGPSLPVELKAGQVVFFSDLLLHSSPPNRSDRARPGFTMTFSHADNRLHRDKNRWGVVCCGQDRHGYWPAHPRPS